MFDPKGVDSRKCSLVDFLHLSSPDLFHKANAFARFLSDARQRGYETYLRPIKEYSGGSAIVDGGTDLGDHRVIIMCSADYLGLARHPKVIQAAKEALEKYGASVSSVPLIAGSTSLHKQFQEALGSFLSTESVVLFPTGHAANQGTISALCSPRDKVILDKMVHYSILDGVRLSGAKWETFRHSDPEHLGKILSNQRARRPNRGILVIIEGVYGNDGDVAPLPEILKVAENFGAKVMVDDAHATGVLGVRGGGDTRIFRAGDP